MGWCKECHRTTFRPVSAAAADGIVRHNFCLYCRHRVGAINFSTSQTHIQKLTTDLLSVRVCVYKFYPYMIQCYTMSSSVHFSRYYPNDYPGLRSVESHKILTNSTYRVRSSSSNIIICVTVFQFVMSSRHPRRVPNYSRGS